MDFPGGSDGKESTCIAEDPGLIPGQGRFPWRREWLLSPVLLPEESHGERSLAGYNPWGRKEPDMTQRTKHMSTREGGRWGTSGESDS